MNSKRLAVFAASLLWADAVKVMSRGTPRSRTSVTWGIRWSVSAAENDGESGGRFPTMRHAHLLGLIGRSHFSAQAQAEESEDRRRLDWDRGNTIFTSPAKRKAESPQNHRKCKFPRMTSPTVLASTKEMRLWLVIMRH